MTRKKLKLISSVIGLLLLLAGYAARQQGWLNAPQQAVVTNTPGLYSINHFVDGDTIAVNMDGKTETVRFIGIDTPETHKPNTPVQCYGPAAAAYTKSLIGTGKVRLQADPDSTNRDRYNRLLRYVYLPDGRLLDAELVKNGYAFAYTQFPFTKSAEFVQYQEQAKEGSKGLWGNCQPYQETSGRWQSNNQ